MNDLEMQQASLSSRLDQTFLDISELKDILKAMDGRLANLGNSHGKQPDGVPNFDSLLDLVCRLGHSIQMVLHKLHLLTRFQQETAGLSFQDLTVMTLEGGRTVVGNSLRLMGLHQSIGSVC